MDLSLFNDVVNVLIPYMDESSRRVLVERALHGSPVLHHITWADNAHDFTTQLVLTLEQRDPLSLASVLKATGQDKAIETLIERLETEFPSSVFPSHPAPPEPWAIPDYPGLKVKKNFIGRRVQLEDLTRWATSNDAQPMLVLTAIGGMGKSALAWVWMQDRAVEFEGGIFWYSFYESGATMNECIRYALAYVTQQPLSKLKKDDFNAQLKQLIAYLNEHRTLLILDGLERILVAYHRWDAEQMQDEMPEQNAEYRNCTNPHDELALIKLAGVSPSRVLVTSRLFPNALLNAGHLLESVLHMSLEGLSLDDARALWLYLGVRWRPESASDVDSFFEHVGRHALTLMIAAKTINEDDHGRFESWYKDVSGQFDFANEDLKTNRHHILAFAYKGLTDAQRSVLAQMATFATGMKSQTLTMFNTSLPPKPEVLEKPDKEPLNLVLARVALKKAYSPEEKAQAQAAVKHEEAKLAAERMAYEASKREVEEWTQSKAYKEANRAFKKLLHNLIARGLLWWNEGDDMYDMHPVVRGYVYTNLSTDERRERCRTTYEILSKQDVNIKPEDARTLADLSLPLAMYQALMGAENYNEAWLYYDTTLRKPLIERIGAYHKAYELLLQLRQALPQGNSDYQEITALIAALLSFINRIDEALVLRAEKFRYDLEHQGYNLDIQDIATLIDAIGDYGRSLMDKNRLAHALRLYELCYEVAALANDSSLLASASFNLLSVAHVLARWEDVDRLYHEFASHPTHQQYSMSQLIWAESLFERGLPLADIEAALEAVADENAVIQRTLARLRGEVALRLQNDVRVIGLFEKAVEQVRKSGVYDPLTFGGLARAYFSHGDVDSARRIIQDVCDDFSAAAIYAADGQENEAWERILAYYQWAWADGEPHVRRYHLDRAQRLFDMLSYGRSDLPVWEKAPDTKFLYEDELQFYLEDQKLKQRHHSELTALEQTQAEDLLKLEQQRDEFKQRLTDERQDLDQQYVLDIENFEMKWNDVEEQLDNERRQLEWQYETDLTYASEEEDTQRLSFYFDQEVSKLNQQAEVLRQQKDDERKDLEAQHQNQSSQLEQDHVLRRANFEEDYSLKSQALNQQHRLERDALIDKQELEVAEFRQLHRI